MNRPDKKGVASEDCVRHSEREGSKRARRDAVMEDAMMERADTILGAQTLRPEGGAVGQRGCDDYEKSSVGWMGGRRARAGRGLEREHW